MKGEAHTWFVTGALGCIGAWVVKAILDRGGRVVVFDLGDDPRRLRDILPPAELRAVSFVKGDITDSRAVASAVAESGATRIVHLAGLQVPFCKADPALGARVNVLGTVNVFEAAKRCSIERVVYASSAAVYGPPESADAPDERQACEPATHYGVYKRANEGTARIYWQDEGLSSVGLRPLTVYGVGRDQGMTSGPTKAMKAVVVGRDYTIGFSGATDFNYVADTAQAFVDCAERAPAGAHVYNLHGDSVRVDRIIELIEEHCGAELRAPIRSEGPELPIPPALDGALLHAAIPNLPTTPLSEGIAETMRRFTELRDEGRLETGDLDT